MKLNLGCGFNKVSGFVNVDRAPECAPAVLCDLERVPWPWEDSSVDTIRLTHVLEHLGETPTAYIAIWKELWRIGKPGAAVEIIVPHWNHENFHHDPTHVRAITPIGVAMFDQARNVENAERGGSESKLGLYAGVDFDVRGEDVRYDYTQEIQALLRSGKMSIADLEHAVAHQANVCEQIRLVARVVKPARGVKWLEGRG